MRTNSKISNSVIYGIIRNHFLTEGVMPSIRELCDLTGICSTSTMHKRLHQLQDLGLIEICPNSPRNYKLTGMTTNSEMYADLMKVFSTYGKVIGVKNGKLVLNDINIETVKDLEDLLLRVEF